MAGTPQWLRDLQFAARRLRAGLGRVTFSTFGEQQIIDKYIDRLAIDERVAVDIGAGDGIRGSNTYHLFRSGWRGIGVEADEAKYARLKSAYRGLAGVTAVSSLVQPSTVAELLSSYHVPRNLGVLSLDIDGNDYWVLDAILADFRPQLVVSEYNEKIPTPIRFVVNYDPAFTLRHHFFGYSIAKLKDLLDKHDYVLLEVEYNNVFIAPAESAGQYGVDIDTAYRAGYLDRPDRRAKFATNDNMEPLYSMPAEDALSFLTEFYKAQAGKYTIEI